MDKRSDTIAAISTPSGIGGIGIIRISGPKALTIINNISRSSFNLLSLSTTKTRKMIHAIIFNGNKEKVDEVLLAFMPPEKSFTGEETIEIQCHGGKAILETVLKLVLDNGSRIAGPGEFTRRAVNNGRINLIQAEAINDLIRARTGDALKTAWRQFDGGLNFHCIELKQNLENIYLWIKSEIEFDIKQDVDLKECIKKNKETIENLLLQTKSNSLDNACIWVTIVGPANSGKSSLFNKILKYERAIVSDIPGTTTDFISESFEIEGKEIKITDTAGFKEPSNEIQKNSIANAIKQQKAADIVIYVVDQSQDISNYFNEIEKVLNSDGIVVFNKCDLTPHSASNSFRNIKRVNCLDTSAICNQGIEELMNTIVKKIKSDVSESSISINLRQKQLLIKAKEEMEQILNEIYSTNLDILCFHIEEANRFLSEIIGDIKNEDTLNRIFSKFCVGK